MSHEIRTPLNGIIGLTQMILETPLNSEQKDYLRGVQSSAGSLLELINDILDFSKIEAGKMDFESVDFNLEQLVTDSLSVIGLAAKRKGLEIRHEIDPQLHAWLKGDMSKIRQILLNLLSNAVKFTHEGAICLRVARQGHLVAFEVEDSGIGVSDQDKLFEVFVQGDSSTRRKFGGTGLGLSICKQLVLRMGGEIGVRSAPKKGSIFWFKLPLQAGVERVTNVPVAPSAGTVKGQRVLVVEDNSINQKVALAAVGRLGLQAQAVANGVEALNILQKLPFDLILMDCHMPEMDGYEATQKIRALDSEQLRSIPIIAMTANAVQGDRDKCLEVGMNDYITKPIDLHEFNRVLLKWLHP